MGTPCSDAARRDSHPRFLFSPPQYVEHPILEISGDHEDLVAKYLGRGHQNQPITQLTPVMIMPCLT